MNSICRSTRNRRRKGESKVIAWEGMMQILEIGTNWNWLHELPLRNYRLNFILDSIFIPMVSFRLWEIKLQLKAPMTNSPPPRMLCPEPWTRGAFTPREQIMSIVFRLAPRESTLYIAVVSGFARFGHRLSPASRQTEKCTLNCCILSQEFTLFVS